MSESKIIQSLIDIIVKKFQDFDKKLNDLTTNNNEKFEELIKKLEILRSRQTIAYKSGQHHRCQ